MNTKAVSVSLLLLFAAAGRAAPSGDLVFLNRAVYTVDAARSWASAVLHDDAIRGSLAIGKAADLVLLDTNLFETAARTFTVCEST